MDIFFFFINNIIIRITIKNSSCGISTIESIVLIKRFCFNTFIASTGTNGYKLVEQFLISKITLIRAKKELPFT